METTSITQQTPPGRRQRLERPTSGRMLGGVATALADATGIAVGIVRIAFIVAAFFGGFGLVIYAAAWALIPTEGQERSAAERWLSELSTPGRKLGAALIAAAVLIVLMPFSGPVVLVGLLVLGAGLLFQRSRTPSDTNS